MQVQIGYCGEAIISAIPDVGLHVMENITWRHHRQFDCCTACITNYEEPTIGVAGIRDLSI